MEFLGYEVDFRWPERRLVVEVDGNHTRPNDKRNDAGRDRVLAKRATPSSGSPARSCRAPARLMPLFAGDRSPR